jgi:hypothetical protein
VLEHHPPETAQAATVGLAVNANHVSTVWTCPDRPGLPVFEAGNDQWIIGYQYFGGIPLWLNPRGSFRGHSPIKLSASEPYWSLAADEVLKVDGAWGGGRAAEGTRYWIYENMPQHRGSSLMAPVGGNQVFVDGSARWIGFDKMYFFHSWNTGSRQAFFYQDNTDFETNLVSALPQLAADNFR